jgi:hypothetical protein
VKRAFFNSLKTGIICLSLAACTLGFNGCGGNDSGDQSSTPSSSVTSPPPATKKAATKSATPTAKASSQTSGKTTANATTKTIPKLTDISFTLTLDPGQEYTEATTPIYLQATQILHLSWLVVKGNHFYLTFSLPNGNLIAVRSNGSLCIYSSDSILNEKLTRNGDLVLRPDDNDWKDGYYIFHSQLYKGDASTVVKLLYWIE